MKNFKNDSGTVENMFAFLMFSLTFSSIIISFILLNAYGYAAVGNEGWITLPGSEAVSTMQNYQTNQISDSANYVTSLGDFVYNSGVGRVLTGSMGYSALSLKGVRPVNNVYTTTYAINNSVNQNYWINPRYAGAPDFYNIYVKISDSGFHIQEFDGIRDRKFCPYTNPRGVTKATLKSVFDSSAGTLQIYFNNVEVCSESGYINPIDPEKYYYASAGSYTNGFTVESISMFVEIMLKLILWNVNSQFLPLELNLIFIKTQAAAIIVCIVVLVRGSG